MKYNKRRSRPMRVREPVQVYLDAEDQARLKRLTDRLSTSKSEALRRGLEALERQVSDPNEHPALRIIGIAGPDRLSDRGTDDEGALDPAREHDRVLTDSEESGWTPDA